MKWVADAVNASHRLEICTSLFVCGCVRGGRFYGLGVDLGGVDTQSLTVRVHRLQMVRRCLFALFVIPTLVAARTTPAGSGPVVTRSLPLGDVPTIDLILYGLVNTAVLVHWRRNYVKEGGNMCYSLTPRPSFFSSWRAIMVFLSHSHASRSVGRERIEMGRDRCVVPPNMARFLSP